MLALFGEGLRPDANAFIAQQVAAGMPFEKARAQARPGLLAGQVVRVRAVGVDGVFTTVAAAVAAPRRASRYEY